MRLSSARSRLSPSFADPRSLGSLAPALALGFLHIFDGSGSDDDLEASHSVVECDWSGWPMRGVAGPSAELGDDPCRPLKRVGAMRVLLKLCPAFHGFVDGGKYFDFFGREGAFDRQLFATIAGLNELNDDTCCFSGDRHELDQGLGAFDLTVLDSQALVLERAKELFDDPALLVPGDDPPSIGRIGDRMSGQEQPMNGLSPVRGVQLDDFHEADFDAFRQFLHAGARRPLEHNGSKAQREMGLATVAIYPLRQIDHRLVAEARSLHRLIKGSAVGQRMVIHSPRQQVDIVAGRQGPVRKELPLTVIDDGDHARRSQNLAALLSRRNPAPRLLVGQLPLVVRGLNFAPARPHLAAGETETGPAVGIDRHHGMQQHAAGIAFADFAQSTPTSLPRLKLDLAGVLDRQHMTPADHGRRLPAPAFNHSIGRDLRIVHEPPVRHVRGPVTLCHLTQADTARAKHSSHKRRPLLSRRTSPNSPSDKSGSCCISDAPSNQASETESYNPQTRDNIMTHRVNLSRQTCRNPSANAGTHNPGNLLL